MAMQRVYFDRNVFADICELRNGLTNENVKKIQRAVDTSSISISASFTLFEETLQVLRQSEASYDQQIKTVLSLIDKRRMIKQPKDILKDDCHTYAISNSQYERTFDVPPQLAELLDPSKNREALLALSDKVSQFFGGAASNITDGLLEAREVGEKSNVGHPDSFESLWDELSLTIVKCLLERHPRWIRRKCIKRGLEGMLRVKSIRLYAIYYVSLVHSGWFGVQEVPRKMKAGDLGDWFHAVQSSAASLFVTQENKERVGKLPFILNQLPTPRFEVLSLQEFLNRI